MSEQGYGGFWVRLLALLVDTVIIVTALMVVAILAIKLLGPASVWVLGIAYMLGPVLYWAIMHASERQATFGKAMLGMVVTTAEGERLSLARSIGRELAKILSGIPLMLGYVAAAFTQRKQALHDVVASTTVMRPNSGRVAVALLVGVLGWLAPIGIAVAAGAGVLSTMASQLRSMNGGVLQSAAGGMGTDADTTAATSATVVQTAMTTAAAPADSVAAAPKPATKPVTPPVTPPAVKTKAPEPERAAPTPQPAPTLAAAPAAAPAQIPRRVAPRPQAEPTVAALDPASAAALDQLSPGLATEIPLVPARFRDRTVQLYDFGTVTRGADAARVFWPIHGFDARGNPVAIRGHRPIFTTLPRLDAYSGSWQLVYVVTADMAQPNALRDAAAVDAAVRAKRAVLREAGLVLSLPIVPRGATLARDTTRGLLGWYQGRDVQFFDFGVEARERGTLLGFAAARDSAGHPIVVPVDSAAEARNLQFAVTDSVQSARRPSPLRAFSDMRSPMPPRPTRSP